MEFDVLKKNIFNKSLAFKSIISFTFLVGITCLLFFMNCSVSEEPLFIDDDQRFSQSTTTTINGFPNLAQTTTTTTTTDDDCANNVPISQLSIVQRVAAKTNDLHKTDIPQFTQYVAECLKNINSNWGRRLDDVGSLASDKVAYFLGDNTSPYSVDIIDSSTSSNPQLVWNVQGDDQCGQAGGTWQDVSDDCVLNQTELEEEEEKCTPQQLRNGYATINSQCLRKCDSFEDTNVQGVTIGKGEQCNDTANFNILAIQDTFEEQLDEPQKCCRKSSKRSCPSNYTTVNEICRPTCQQAAQLKGYTTNYFLYRNKCSGGFDRFCTQDCDDLKDPIENHKDWQDFTFYDPYSFTEIKSEVEDNIYFSGDDDGCCVRGSQNTQAQESYDSKGWHPDDYTLD